jgi:hypothetical protein
VDYDHSEAYRYTRYQYLICISLCNISDYQFFFFRTDSIPLVLCLERSGRQQPSPIIERLLSIPEVPLRDSSVQAIHSRKISRPTPYSLHGLRIQRLATIPSIDDVLTQYGNSRGISDIGHSHFSVTNLTVGANTEYISCTRRSISRLIDYRSYDCYVYLPRD